MKRIWLLRCSCFLKHGAGFTDQVSSQKRSQTFTAASVVNASLLKAANEKAELRLNSLKSNNPATLKAQAQLYANALALAQKRSDERLQSRAAGLINLGGGLTISQSELDKLASTYVQPILDDIEGKAEAKRQIDIEKKQKELELQQLHEKAKRRNMKPKKKRNVILKLPSWKEMLKTINVKRLKMRNMPSTKLVEMKKSKLSSRI